MKKKTRKLAKKVGVGAGILGGIAAAGYAAKRLLKRSHESPEEQNRRDAARAVDFDPSGTFEYASRDSIGDPSARTSVGLDTSAANRPHAGESIAG